MDSTHVRHKWIDMQTLTQQPYRTLSIHEQIGNYALKYVIPFAFGYGPDPDNYIFNSGTATLINLGGGPLALTCEHVATPFREFRELNKSKINAELYIGGATGVDRKIIAWDEALDIATLQLTEDELTKIPYGQNVCGTDFINKVYTGPIKEGDEIVFVGFPSESSWRYKNKSNNLFSFHSCICFTVVASVNEDYIICQADYIRYESKYNQKLALTDDPTGMSGGAAFLARINGTRFSCEFIGVVSGGKFLTQDCLTTYIKLAKRLNSDGTIKEAII